MVMAASWLEVPVMFDVGKWKHMYYRVFFSILWRPLQFEQVSHCTLFQWIQEYKFLFNLEYIQVKILWTY